MAAVRCKMRDIKSILDKTKIVISRSITCSPAFQTFITRFTEKPKKKLIPKKRILPWKNVVEKPRDDVYFLREQNPPSHTFQEALDVLRAYAFADETVAVNLRLNMLEKKIRPEAVKGTMLLPKPFKPKRILVFAEGELAVSANASGADIVGGKELIPKVEAGEFEFDYCLSSLEFLPNIYHMPKILKDKMPNTRRGTATNNLSPAVAQYRRGHSYKSTHEGLINSEIALLSFTNDKIRENLRALVTAVESHKPEKIAKDRYFKKIALTSERGPGLILHTEEIYL